MFFDHLVFLLIASDQLLKLHNINVLLAKLGATSKI